MVEGAREDAEGAGEERQAADGRPTAATAATTATADGEPSCDYGYGDDDESEQEVYAAIRRYKAIGLD